MRANLRPIDIRVVIVQSLGCLSGPDPKVRTADIMLLTRATQLLDPEPFLDAATGDASAFGHASAPILWRDRRYRDRVVRAHALNGAARLAAYAQIERDMLTRAAPYAAYGAFAFGEYLSPRSGCRVVQGAYGAVDLAALCIRAR